MPAKKTVKKVKQSAQHARGRVVRGKKSRLHGKLPSADLRALEDFSQRRRSALEAQHQLFIPDPAAKEELRKSIGR